jgi:hypothetical protein
MARTRAEIRAFHESLVGRTCVDKSNHELNGQCVCFIKCLLEFLGVPNPYIARGHAKDYGDALIRQGIGTNGKGWLTVCISRTMGVVGGVTYGHIWDDLAGEANYESNGARALIVTKNTRPMSQATQFIDLDKWVKEGGDMPITKEQEQVLALLATGSIPGKDYNYPFVGTSNVDGMLNFWKGQAVGNPGRADGYTVEALAESLLLRTSSGDKYLQGNVGLPVNQAIDNMRSYPEAKEIQRKARDYDKLAAKIKELEEKPADDFEEIGNNTGLFQRKKK